MNDGVDEHVTPFNFNRENPVRSLLFAVLIVGISAAPSFALPSINLVRTGPTTGRLDVIVTGSGSIAAELSLVSYGGYAVTNVAINAAIVDTANPGDSPFIAGSPEGGDSVGLTFEPELGRAFASFGSGVVASPGTYNFLTFDYSQTPPLPIGFSGFTADGFVAQAGVLRMCQPLPAASLLKPLTAISTATAPSGMAI